MRALSCGIWLLLHVTATYNVVALTEHKVHNIVLYPDKHSWCKTTEIKQIVAYPGCSSIEIDNNVCVGACFSYSIPRTIPSAPGEVIIPYCDSCQPVEYEWREVTLTCSDESAEEDEGQTEMTKRVQVITNCSCTSCDRQYEEKRAADHHKHTGGKSSDDVPELMSLMMGVHRGRPDGPTESEEEEEAAEDVNVEMEVAPEKDVQNTVKEDDKENLIREDDDDDIGGGVDEEDEHEKRLKAKLDKESRTLEILHFNKRHHSSNSSKPLNDIIEIAKTEHKHYEFGPHHTLVLKPDDDSIEHHGSSHPHPHHHHPIRHDDDDHDGGGDEDEDTPSLMGNQFKIHDNEEYLDQIAVESIQKEVQEQKTIMTVPDMIYNGSLSGVRMLEVPHHHLQPAVAGVEVSYYGKSESKQSDKIAHDND